MFFYETNLFVIVDGFPDYRADMFSASIVPVPLDKQKTVRASVDEGLCYRITTKLTGAVVDRKEGVVHFLSLTRGLVSYWRFMEGKGRVARDFSGNGNSVTLKGLPRWVPGARDRALSLDGKDDCLVISYGVGQWPDKAVSMSFWVQPEGKTNSLPKKNMVRGSVLSDAPIRLWFDESGKLCLRSRGEVMLMSRKSLADGAWHNIVLTGDLDSSRVQMYVDGRLDGSVNINNIIPKDWTGKVGWFSWVGRNQNESNAVGMFKGRIDEMCIYRRILSGGEVKMLVAMKKTAK